MRKLTIEEPTKEPFGTFFGMANFTEDSDVRDKKVLDLGCGYGWCEINFLERGVKKMIGLDVSKEAVQTASKYVRDRKINFLAGDASNLSFDNESFDTVVCWEVFEHIDREKEELLFSEVNRVLKRKGFFYLSTPYDSLLGKFFDPARWLIGHRHYSKERLAELGKSHGFKIQKSVVMGGWYTVLYSLNMYFSKWILRRRPLFDKSLRPFFTKEYAGDSGFMTIFVKYQKNDR